MESNDKIIAFAKQEAGDMSVEFHYKNEKVDGYSIIEEDGSCKVSASNARSCLYAIYHVLSGLPRGEFKAEFPIRGINAVESLARHSEEQIRNLIDRMARWRMNTLVVHTAYGWNLHKQTIINECEKRGIEIVFYVYTSLAFLKNCGVEYFATKEDGEPFYRTLEWETRLCISKEKGLAILQQGCREYFKNELTENGGILLCPADGMYICRCPACVNLSAIEQWEPVLEKSVNVLKEIKPRASLESLIYVQRYAVPVDMKTYHRLDRILFDIHRRYRWAALGESHPEAGNSEYEYDTEAVLPTNMYLYKKLKDWRKAFDGAIYIHDNLMLQGSMSCPQPNTTALLKDLRLYKLLGIQGVIYEAFGPGIGSFTSQIKTLADAMWDLNVEYIPSEIEKWCLNAKISTGALFFRKENNFPWGKFKGIYDDVVYAHMKNIADFYDNPSIQNCRVCVEHMFNFPDRFDILFVSFNLFKHLRRNGLLELSKFTGTAIRFFEVTKLWDFMEVLKSPFEETLALVKYIQGNLTPRRG